MYRNNFNDLITKFVPFYATLNKKKQAVIRNQIFNNFLFLFLSSMFEYDNAYEGMNTDFIDFYGITEGIYGAFDKEGKKIIGRPNYGGGVDEYGLPLAWNITTLNATNIKGALDEVNCAIGYNNKLHTGDYLNIQRYAMQFSEVDISQYCNVRFARLKPIPMVDNESDKNEIDKIIEDTNFGKIQSFVSKSKISRLTNNNQTAELINLTDVSAIDKLQYLSTYHNDLLRRFFTMYGMALGNSMKQAQQTIEEITSDTASSFIIPIQMLHERQKFCDKCNALWGGNMSVHFSEPWMIEYRKFASSDDATTEGAEGNVIDNKQSV